jgi:selenocysteine-specific elongation factor
MIVATAGHIDHGKTSLVKALTGVDTDRLPEEKKRGLSIDLGFAYPKDNSRIGFVDVPGHERLVRNMIAGVTCIDCALIVIAADDGPMPQTREHLSILELLGIKKAIVALTKIDRVSGERMLQAQDEIRELLSATPFAGSDVFPASAVTGLGIADLKSRLNKEAQKSEPLKNRGHFRMAVDRAFVIDGAGIVVTGAVSSGSVKIDERLVILPEMTEVRVRGIHAQNRKSTESVAGERCALNIAAAKLSLENLRRGQWLVGTPIAHVTSRFDARLKLLASEARALRHWSQVHLHIGAADFLANIAVLGARQIEPGESALAQIVTEQRLSALSGEHFILRDPSGQRTLGGGRIIDPFAPARGRAKPERTELLKCLDTDDEMIALEKSLEHSPAGFAFGAFICARNLDLQKTLQLTERLKAKTVGEGFETLAFAGSRWNELLNVLRKQMTDATKPVEGFSKPDIAMWFQPRLPALALDALLEELVKRGDIAFAGGHYRPRGLSLQIDPRDAALWQKVHLVIDNIRPPSLVEIAAACNTDARSIERLLRNVARQGLAVQIAPNRYYLPGRLRELAHFAELVANETAGGLVSIRAFRDRSGIGRNLSVEALEFFDRLGFTGKAGEHRRVLKQLDQVRWVRGTQ